MKRGAKERVARFFPRSFVLFDLDHALAAKSALLNSLRLSQPFSIVWSGIRCACTLLQFFWLDLWNQLLTVLISGIRNLAGDSFAEAGGVTTESIENQRKKLVLILKTKNLEKIDPENKEFSRLGRFLECICRCDGSLVNKISHVDLENKGLSRFDPENKELSELILKIEGLAH